jgi:acetylornithine/N-succinyldiaminopimelate aminotransferase
MNLFDVYPLYDICPVRAQGSYLWDDKGQKYLDLYGGHAVISIGHTHPHYVEMLTQQLSQIGFYSNAVQMPLQKRLAQKLGELSGYPEYALFLCNSGAEANENAFKLASFHNGRKKIIAFKGSFHGRTSLAVAATDDPKIVAPVNETPNVVYLPLNDEQALEQAIDGETCAVIVEGIQGVGGIQIPTTSFLQKIASLCEQHGAIFIADEVQSGYGRSGHFFAHQHAGVRPHIISIAKGMGNGFPVAGILINPLFKAKYSMLGTTFGGNHLACAAAIAVLETIENEQLIQNAQTVGEYWIQALRQFPTVKEVRGQGLMIGVEMHEPIDALRKKLLFEHHIFTGSSSNKNVIRLLPALNLSKTEADIFLKAFEAVLLGTGATV